MKHNAVTLACPELPAPVRDPHSGRIASVQDLQIQTTLNNEEAIGYFHRHYAPPSLTHTFLNLIKQASNTVTQPGSAAVTALIGKKAIGKTSIAIDAAYLVDGRNPLVFDCGNKSLDELLWEPVLNNSGKNLVSRLEERFNEGTIHPLNRNFIKSTLPEAIVTEDGREKLDFGLISPDKIQEALTHMKAALELEGIAPQTGIDVTYKPGPLIRVWEDAKAGRTDRPCRIVVDEIDKRAPNSGKSLQQIWLVLAGLLDTHTVSKNGEEYTFSKADIPPGFSVNLTGNDVSDLGESSGLSQSQLSRMSVVTLPDSTEDDLAHRICQQLTGVPFGVLDTLAPETNEHTKASILMHLRTMGGAPPPTAEETWMIENHERTRTAAKQLAGFYSHWARLVDPENPELNDPDIEQNIGFREPPDVRMAHAHIKKMKANDLLELTFTEATPSPDPIRALLEHNQSTTPPARSIGSRLTHVVLEAIANSSPNDTVKAHILQTAKLYGLMDDPDEEDTKNSKHQPISALLDNLEETIRITPATKALQKNLHAALVAKHPDLANGPDMETLLPSKDLQAAVNQQHDLGAKRTTDQTTYILNVNPNYLKGNKREKAVECIPVISTTEDNHTALLSKMGRDKVRECMMETETLKAILVTPEIGATALDSLWNKSWKDYLGGALGDASEVESIQISSGTSQTLRVAKVLTKGDDGIPEASLVFQSNANRVTWLLTEKGEEKTVEHTAGKVVCMPVSSAAQFEESLNRHVPNLSETALVDVLWALTPNNAGEPQDKSIREYIERILTPTEEEKQKKTRFINTTKIPLRTNLPAEIS